MALAPFSLFNPNVASLRYPGCGKYSYKAHLSVIMPLMLTESQHQKRSLNEIAAEIQKDWGDRLSNRAAPYVEAMSGLRSIHDQYGLETGADVVRRFLLNAEAWRGQVAQRIKSELGEILKGHKAN